MDSFTFAEAISVNVKAATEGWFTSEKPIYTR
jgi:hypothetical protein